MLTIRPATADDERALRRLDVLTTTAEVSPAPPRSPDDPFFEGRRQPADVLVAEDDGSVVGYAELEQQIGIPSHAHVLTVGGLAVDPVAQGRGVGRELVEAAVAEARTRGARKVTLRVLGPNARARSLYHRCGFVVEGVLRAEFVLDGRDVADVLMALALD